VNKLFLSTNHGSGADFGAFRAAVEGAVQGRVEV
jgi:hypothetical protein